MRTTFLSLLLTLLLGTISFADTPILKGESRFHSSRSRHGMVVAGEELAARAGLEVLREGGNAVDAAVTTAFALAVTLPRAGNLGGGGFMLIRSPKGQVYALDFREKAPAGATRDMFLDDQGKVDRQKASTGALCVGVPGTVAGLEEALSRHGTISLRRAVSPAERMAREGIPATPWLSEGLASVQSKLKDFPATAAAYYPAGEAPRIGEVFLQPDLAWSLRRLAEKGGADFYKGELAARILKCMDTYSGVITAADLNSYEPVWRRPLSGKFGDYRVYSMPPPSSGGVHLIQMLNVLEGREFKASRHNSAAELHFMAETMRRAYADRSRWLGDPDYFKVPLDWLLSPSYARELRSSIDEASATPSSQVRASRPPGWESPDTTHLSVVDKDGWAVSLTTTINFSYGSGLVAEGTGFLLNNEMDDFAAAPGQANAFGMLGGDANSIQPGKRPLSSMTPTIVERDGRLAAVLGAPGGSRIITSVYQVLVNALGYGFNAQTAVSMPRIHHQWFPDRLYYEHGVGPETLEGLRALGHKVELMPSMGHVMLILVRPDGSLEGGADPRRPASAQGH